MRSIRIAREARRWSRAELARRAGMNAVTVGQIELGRLLPYPSQIRKLASALGLGVQALATDEPGASIEQPAVSR